jgi:ppGpp synthetase/RelA/SpoT-type nucleotidyltranferase
MKPSRGDKRAHPDNGQDALTELNDPRLWYSARIDAYFAFTQLVHATIENLIRSEGIDYLSVTSRTKSVDSFAEKMKRKAYESVERATDLSGVRVITFIEKDARRTADLLRSSFVPHLDDSMDKSEELGDSQVGYRSIHITCELGDDRTSLPEYKPFKGLVFEIQVRTILQHAWAEIDHDRAYKFNGVLPADLRRRLNLIAGQLELADREFGRLADDVDKYTAELREKEKRKDLNIEVSSASLHGFCRSIADRHKLPIKVSRPDKFASVIDELQRFGVSTLLDVNELMSNEFLANLGKSFRSSDSTTEVGLLRKAMMYKDVDKYFAKAWRGDWDSMTASTKRLLALKWGEDKLRSIVATFLARKS